MVWIRNLWICDDEAERFAVPDTQREHAYEQTTAQQRACLKTAIAFHCLTEQNAEHETQLRTYTAKGYWKKASYKAVPWVLCFCNAQYNAPARLIAALMPALLAHAGRVALIGVDSIMPSLLVAAELMGVEDIFAVPAHILDKRHTHQPQTDAHESQEKGRALFLHAPYHEPKYLWAPLQECMRMHNIPSWYEENLPRIHVHATLSPTQKDLLLWAQADALFTEAHKADILYGGDAHTTHISQAWGSGMEGCFVHNTLERRFFQNTTRAAGLYDGKDFLFF